MPAKAYERYPAQMKLFPKRKVCGNSATRRTRLARVRQFVRPDNNANEDSERRSTTCRWVHLPSLGWPGRLCGRPGYPYCSEHQRELAAMEQADSLGRDLRARGWARRARGKAAPFCCGQARSGIKQSRPVCATWLHKSARFRKNGLGREVSNATDEQGRTSHEKVEHNGKWYRFACTRMHSRSRMRSPTTRANGCF